MKDSKAFRKFETGVFALTAILILIIVPLYAYKVHIKTDYTDFLVYFRAALRTQAQDWANIYTSSDGPSPFRYMPPFLIFFSPLARLSKEAAQLVWYFLQLLAFSGGFYLLFKSLRATAFTRNRIQPERKAALVTCLSFLFVLRLCLDTLTIGQVSSFMFLGFTLGLWGYVRRSPSTSAFGLALPALLKVGPAIVYGVFLSPRNREKWKAFRMALGTLLGFLCLGELWGYFTTGSLKTYHSLWLNWAQIVAADSQYYDSSHYGSQSFNSALLRAAKSGWLSEETAGTLYLIAALLVCASIVLFWILRSPKSTLGRGLFFSLGLFPYFWLMPETFKYSLTPLSIAVAFLMASLFHRSSRIAWSALAFGAATISLAGKDVIGDSLFFGSQKASLPLLATLFLGLATLAQAWFHSNASSRARFLEKVLQLRSSSLGPWNRLPEPKRSLDVSVLLPLPLSNSCVLDSGMVLQTLRDLTQALAGKTFEILLIPYGNRLSEFHPVLKMLRLELQKKPSAFKILETSRTRTEGRGAALREGFLSSLGQNFLIAHLEQPCGTEFFKQSLNHLEKGYDLVRANRRLAESHFEIPVRLLPIVYSRHRLGLWFNRIVRLLLPVQTTDTHSGNYALSWRLATHAFATQISTDFLFDLELSLTAHAQKLKETDLPVEVRMEAEKTRSRMFFETLTILRGLPILRARYRKGYYGSIARVTQDGFSNEFSAQIPTPISPELLCKISADDWGLSPGVNHGILALARQGIVRRISMMANSAHLQEGLGELLTLGNRVELGLHFNLTYARPLQTGVTSSLLQKDGTFLESPFSVLLQWLKGVPANTEFVKKEFRLQLGRLLELGVPVSYLDGHHHIHMVPGMLDALAPLLREFKIQQVRLPLDLSLLKTSQAPVTVLALLARSKFEKYGFNYLPFAYPRTSHFQDPGMFRSYLRNFKDTEIIVHPAMYNDLAHLSYPDPYTEGRVTEFQALQMLGISS